VLVEYDRHAARLTEASIAESDAICIDKLLGAV
jgi:hypothetical protein